MSIVIDKSKDLIEKILNNIGYELVDINFKKTQMKDPELILIIEKTNNEPITLDDCVKVNEALDEPLDTLNPTNNEPYNLTVFSRPLDYPLLREKDFIRCLNKDVDMSFYKKQQDLKEKKITAKLISFSDLSIEIEYKNKKYKILRSDIASIKQSIYF